ncbi:peptidoglycan DD-metalloendopeptidase family protein [Hyunsoonleella sp. SJ7]|uniref:Peptidoglycan DD-metalloendopeptidase family protein n=1 Tax=Hyunsoonleella aquatilis TaxID=2762758 RepID=A0A923KLE8_9FLAO|nr:peptidoglycan DD-metalloendopeptidase family protein [Hyunsoonleella aquatilis]MBC3759427.1 peptidoglycan DD-metalloendopeptidase family protein [Hyunsoonleella aquatilis]
MAPNEFKTFLKSISPEPLHVLDASIPKSKYVHLDLSESNLELQNVNTASSEDFSKYINSCLRRHNAHVAYGGYNEVRTIYNRSHHFNTTESERRNIHLGLDLWCDAGTPIYAPLDGEVHSFKNNDNFGDYGPTIILEHNISGVQFYTLYGHLSLESITDLRVGRTFKKGEVLATLGDANVNGDYPPHLHFQIIRDLQGYFGDYPGVCSKTDLGFYLGNCPDPGLVLGV